MGNGDDPPARGIQCILEIFSDEKHKSNKYSGHKQEHFISPNVYNHTALEALQFSSDYSVKVSSIIIGWMTAGLEIPGVVDSSRLFFSRTLTYHLFVS